MLKLGTHIPNMTDATSLYRAMGPIANMRIQYPDLTTHHLHKYNWATLAELDVLFMQRPYTIDEVGIMEMAKDDGIPVWIDYDDLLLNVPTDNPAYFLYSAAEKVKNMRFLIENADHVTVSTPELKTQIQKLNKNITVIPNAIDMRYFSYRKEPPKRMRRVAWRGSKTHHRDVFTYCQMIHAKHMEHKAWEWHFIGDNLWFLTDNMVHERTMVVRPLEWPEYFRHMWQIAPAVMMVPLHEHPFNWCKSNIAWLEAAFAGAVTIAPDWGEWQRPGILNFKNETEFGEQLEKVLAGGLDVTAMAKDAWDYIQDNLTLEKVNRVRLEVLLSLSGR